MLCTKKTEKNKTKYNADKYAIHKHDKNAGR